MNNHWHTNFPLTQDGPVEFRYRIYPHEAYDVVDANRFGTNQAQPLVHVVADKDPNIQPIIAIDNPKVYSTIVKSLDTDNAFVIRLRSLSDKAEHVKLSFPKKEPKEINICDWGETPKEKTGKELELNPYGLVTLHVAY